ncbi:hypothetical protein [Loigolactobacillus iwatensis]|uniref:hypothetical protein n=1 Tax=Loigolactobacillus iwatensis TaxID=1267156 RepID=UPI000F7D8017|nr:hypothetical protein [Loigolactobacillus iwatensis]
MFKQVILTVGLNCLLVIIVPTIFAMILTFFNRSSKQMLVSRFGFRSQIYFGWLGIISHELSHLLVAKLFHHQIISVKLVSLRPTDATLGHVEHQYNAKSWYQNLGNFFIGIAPIYGCSLILLGLASLIYPELWSLLRLDWPALDFTQLHQLLWQIISHGQYAPWKLLVYFLLATQIVFGGFDLSHQDFQGSLRGILPLVLVLSLLALGAVLVQLPLVAILTTVTLIFGTLLGYAVILSFFYWLLLRLITR